MADPDTRDTDGAPPTHVHIEETRTRTRWLPWVLLALGVLALLFGLSRCGREELRTGPADNSAAADNGVIAGRPAAPRSLAVTGAVGGGAGAAATAAEGTGATTPAGTSGLGAYLAGSEPAPRTFTFEKLNFDTAKSDIRPADRAEVDQIAGVLQHYGNAAIRIAGYADARGSKPANIQLGKARAEAVKAALVAQGVAANRIETVSGGASDPADTNATASGRAENRRTELVVTRR